MTHLQNTGRSEGCSWDTEPLPLWWVTVVLDSKTSRVQGQPGSYSRQCDHAHLKQTGTYQKEDVNRWQTTNADIRAIGHPRHFRGQQIVSKGVKVTWYQMTFIDIKPSLTLTPDLSIVMSPLFINKIMFHWMFLIFKANLKNRNRSIRKFSFSVFNLNYIYIPLLHTNHFLTCSTGKYLRVVVFTPVHTLKFALHTGIHAIIRDIGILTTIWK